jgi:GNAT superfamily N-acetyltransferase
VVADIAQAIIRVAVVADVPRLVEMGERFHAASPYRKHMVVDQGRMSALATQLVKAGGVLAVEHDGKLVGMLGFLMFDHPMSGIRTAGELFWWIEPEHRGEGGRLLQAAEDLAREQGAKNILMIAPDERVGVLYRRRNYQFVESAYQKALC